MGTNWRSNYDRSIVIESSTNVVVQRANGKTLNFTQSGGIWSSDGDVDITLTNSGTSWTLTDSDDTVETYTTNSAGTAAVLNTITLRDGYEQTLSYGTLQQLSSVTDTYGRTLTFTVSGTTGLLQSISTPDSTTISYTYNGSGAFAQLTTVTFPTSPATNVTYNYANSSVPNALTSIIDENGNTFTSWTYDAYGRGLTSQSGTGANLTTLTYNDTTGSRTVTNALGVTDTYTFTTLQNVPKVTGISRAATSTTAAATESMSYDSNGYRSSFTDWNGNVTNYTNNSHGLPTQIVEAYGSPVVRTTTIAYDSTWVHLPDTITTPGLTTSFTYDSYGEVLTKTLADTTTQSIPYSTNGQTRTTTNTYSNYLLASVKTPNGHTTSFGYDSSGALTSITDALSHVTNITSHTGGGLPETIVDPNGITTTLAYSPRQWLLSSAVSGSGGTFTTTWQYDAAGNMTKKTLPDNSYEAPSYDTAHRVIKVTNALGEYANFTLDALGDITAYSYHDSSGGTYKTHSDSYDALGRQLVDTGGRGQTVTLGYDADSNILTVKDGNSHTTTNVYDALNHRTSSTDPNSGVVAFTYDAHDRKLTVSDKDSNVTSYVYDGFGDQIQAASPDTGTTVYRYDADANLTKKTDASGNIMNAHYDALDRNTDMQYPGDTTKDVWKTYDQTGWPYGFGIGHLTTVSDAAGCCYALGYDERGNVNVGQRTIGSGYSTIYPTYDAAGRLSGITYPSGIFVGYQRDTMGRVNEVFVNPSGSTTPQVVAWLGNAPFGPMNYVTYGNGLTGPYQLDQDYSIYNIKQQNSGGTVLQNLTYTLDNNNNVTGINDAVHASNSQTLGYDVMDRLTSAVSGTGGYGSYSFQYDKNGNMASAFGGGWVLSYAPGTNRLTQWSFPGSGTASINYGYTATGNVNSVTQSGSSTQTYNYDVTNHLASITGVPLATTHVYDWRGWRTSFTDSGYPPTYFTYDLSGNLLEENDNGTITDHIYVDGRPIGVFMPTSGGTSGTMYYVTDDRIGTPQYVTDSAGSTVWSRTYAPFGTPETVTGSLNYYVRFPGQYADNGNNSTKYNLNRFYYDLLDRYLQADSIGLAGGLNPYLYANANPFTYSDRLGMDSTTPIDMTLLWRSVKNSELQQILKTQTFQSLTTEPKYFSTSPGAAACYARQAYTTWPGEGQYTLVSTSFPTDLISTDMTAFVDGGVPAVTIPPNQLSNLTTPQVETSMPTPDALTVRPIQTEYVSAFGPVLGALGAIDFLLQGGLDGPNPLMDLFPPPGSRLSF